MSLSLGSRTCLSQAADSTRYFPLTYHQIVADSVVTYSGYCDRKASKAFLAAGKSGARRVTHFVNGVGVTFSGAMGLNGKPLKP